MKKLLFIQILIVNLFNAQGVQNNKNFGSSFFPQSPNSTPFAEQGKFPVNMYKGTAAVNIPLFSNQNGMSNFTISLDYNVNSVKPATIPTWTGLGWSLNIGGAITRIVNGGVDEVYTSTKTPYNLYSYLDDPSILNSPTWDSQSDMEDYAENNLEYVLTENSAIKPVPSPDEFIINIDGITGSFYMNEKKQWIARTRDGKTFKVDYTYKYDYELPETRIVGSEYTDVPEYHHLKRILYGFTIIMDNGTRYLFGQDDNNIEFSSTAEQTDTNFNPQIIPTAWHIKEIIYSDSKKVKFTYERDLRAVFLINRGANASFYKQGSSGWFNVSNASSGANFNDLQSNRMNNIFLSKVEGNEFIIEFSKVRANQKEYGQFDFATEPWISDYLQFIKSYYKHKHWFSLTNIYIKDKTGKLLKNISFVYNNDPYDRLMLKHLNINGIEKYNFQYNSQKLPEYISDATDHWGHFNGSSFYESIPSGLSVDQLKNLLTNTYSSYKIPHLAYSRAQTLEKIIYPTRGSSTFEYELNDYSKYGEKDINQATLKINSNITGSEVAGGLRIKKITNCDEDANCTNKSYSYLNDDGSSSGILPYKPLYMIEGSNASINLDFWEFNSNTYQSLKGEDNSICYSKVTEIDDNGGKKEMYFTNLDQPDYIDRPGNLYHGWKVPALFKQLPYLSFSFMRGKVLKEVVYSPTKKLSETVYTYTKKTDYLRAYSFTSKKFGQANFNGAFYDLEGISYGYLLDAHYVNFNSSFLSQKETIFDGVTTTENFLYDYTYNNPTSITTTNGNSISEKSLKYASDINNSAMMDSYMVGVPVSETYKKNGIVIKKSQSIYPSALPTSQTGSLLLPLSESSADLQNNSTWSTELTYDKYDVKGNLLQYTTKDNLPTVIIWGYNKTKPIAKIEGATYPDPNHPKPTTDIPQTLITTIESSSNTDAAAGAHNNENIFISVLNNFRKDPLLEKFQITTYTYDQLVGVRSITPPSGNIEFYNYDSYYRVENIRDKDNNIIKEFRYNYAKAIFYNDQQMKTFNKDDCGPDHFGSPSNYIVPAKKYSSLIGLDDANQKALDEINANGQETANNNGTCTHQCVSYGDAAYVMTDGAAIVIEEVSPNHYSGSVYVTFIANAHFAVSLGYINTCTPNISKIFYQTINGITWTLKLNSDGEITLQANTGTNTEGKSVSFSFEYDK